MRKNLPALAIALPLVACSSLALAGPADTVYQPIVEKGETEFELRGGYREFNGASSEHALVFDVGYGVSNNWRTELVLEYSSEQGNPGKLEAWEWENVFVLTEQGKYWADVGLFAEYEHGFSAGPDQIKIGPMFQKDVGHSVANLNLLFNREVGGGASDATMLDYTWQVRWLGKPSLEWGLQGIGGLGELDHLGRNSSHSLGPALFGVRQLASGNKISYNAAVLAGLNSTAANVTARFQIEYEVY